MRPEGVRRSRSRTVVRLVGLRIWICRIVTTSFRASCGNEQADGASHVAGWRDRRAEAPLASSKGSRRCTGDPPCPGWNATIRAVVAVGPVGRCARGADRVARDELVAIWMFISPGSARRARSALNVSADLVFAGCREPSGCAGRLAGGDAEHRPAGPGQVSTVGETRRVRRGG